jgi:hypothetical protein
MVARQSLLVSILGALSACSTSFDDEGCMAVAETAASCPSGDDVKPSQLFLPGKCGDDLEIVEVNGNGTLKKLGSETGETNPACCYPVTVVDHNTKQECMVGRPFYERGKALAARVLASSPRAAVRDASRAAAWARAGAEEHASVAAFSRLSLELMALGAPIELLREVHQAALDELAHTERCFELSRHFGGAALRADSFPFSGPIRVDTSLAELAHAAAREGCLAETLGAILAGAAAELAPEPEVRAALAGIAAEEARHAVLSYRIVAWALREGGDAVRAAVRVAFASAWPEPELEELALRANVPAAELRTAWTQGVLEVLTPAAAALLAA